MSNPVPFTIPSLQEWQGRSGRYAITDATQLVIDQPYWEDLKHIAQIFLVDLQMITSKHVGLVKSSHPKQTDIFLSLDCDDKALSNQGYLLDIADAITFRAHTASGMFYGLQTILQLFRQQADGSVPQGLARDYPRFTHRAIMLDAGRKYWEMDYLHGLMKTMARFKLNELHLHLTDAHAFRLESERHPLLSAEKSYSKVDIAQLQAWADQYHIILTPEIDLPAHSVVINQYKPRLAFKCKSMAYGRWSEAQNGNWTINYADPYARQWIKDLLSEYIPLFSGPYFHIGTDEVPDGDAPAQCPELVQYAQSKGYHHVGDVFVEWINEMNQFVRSFGKQMQIWSWWERTPHSISPDKNILVNVWVEGGDSHLFLDAGYPVIHTSEDTLYLTPGLDLFPKEEYLYSEWRLSEHPHSLGYKICVWADKKEEEPDDFYEKDLYLPRAILAERTWRGVTLTVPLIDFIKRFERLIPRS